MSLFSDVKSGKIDPMTLPNNKALELIKETMERINTEMDDLRDFLKEECPDIDPEYPTRAAQRAIIELKTEIKLLREAKLTPCSC